MKIRIKRKLKEISTSGAISGAPGGFPTPVVDKFNKEEEKVSKLKGERLEEMFSTSTQTGGVRISVVSPEAEHAGHVERSQHQGLRNVMQEIEDTIDLNDPDASDKLMGDVDDDTEPPESPTQAQLNYKELYQMVLKHGYRLDRPLGTGNFGMVFSAEDLSSGGDYVIKVVGYGESRTPISQEVIDRELSNYNTVSQAAATDERMWRHFPETYDTWKDKFSEGLEVGFIVMEKLVPLTAKESAFIPDVNYIIAKKKPMDAADVADYGIGRDQSTKAKWYLQNEMDSLSWTVEGALAVVTGDTYAGTGDEKLDNIMASVNPRQLARYERIHASSPEKITALIRNRIKFMKENLGYGISNYYYIMREEVQDADWAILILMDIMIAVVKAGEIAGAEENVISRQVQAVATELINGYRKATAIPLSFNSRNIEQDERTRANYHSPGRDLFQAIQLLHKKTGLIAKDVHDLNVMKREGSGDIVIVDLGLFKMDPAFDENDFLGDGKGLDENITKDRGYRIKILTNTKK